MDGLFLINKPIGLTSRDVDNKIARKFHQRKIGHIGTLDPFASGLLVVALGKATKVIQFLEDSNKHYIAELKLGIKTDTLDHTGKMIQVNDVPHIAKKEVEDVLKSFLGVSTQVPPMYSALKQNGVPLYKLARQNKEVERKERSIKIYKIRLLSFKDNVIKFSLTCSKGTYIRTLGEDIACKLNTCGHLISLKRTKVGNFNIKDAKSLRHVNEEHLLSTYDALKHLKIVEVDEIKEKEIKDGKKQYIELNDNEVLFVTKAKTVLAVYQKTDEQYIYKSVRGLF